MIWNIPPNIFSKITCKDLQNCSNKNNENSNKAADESLPCLSVKSSSLPYEPYSIRQTAFHIKAKQTKILTAIEQLVSEKQTSVVYLNAYANKFSRDVYKYLEKWSDEGLIQRRHLTTIQQLLEKNIRQQ